MTPTLVLFGTEHALALAVTAAGAVAMVLWARRLRRAFHARRLRHVLATLMVVLVVVYFVVLWHEGTLDKEAAPLHLCDLAVFLGVHALFTMNQVSFELLYFWAFAGTSMAILTPDLDASYPDWRFFTYFGMHGLVVVSAAVLTFGLGMRPREGAPWRVLLFTNVYALLVAGVNVVFGTNFMYLSRKPPTETPLDWLGPWPYYLIAAEGIALAMFWLLDLPFRIGGRKTRGVNAPNRA
ncbi:MAG: TIGR02206 family membrane protein [Deltaproteobacteria bacterium]|nr:TIGR02206 family membrane protein [Deltaproteobacteria bacterium]